MNCPLPCLSCFGQSLERARLI
nr:hypothetical protein SHINE37_70151 [Rhizobiaceae bacterium]